ncbi:MAG: hypothetical protein J6Y14_10445 [Fibrobacter sp.]|nr:hypothetical protein [Fibrobacter sp.]
MLKNIKRLFVIAVCLWNSVFSAEDGTSYYLLRNAEIKEFQESDLPSYVRKFFGKEADLNDFVLIEGTTDSLVSLKSMLISMKTNEIYVWAEPGLVNIKAWDPIIDCLHRHVDAVDEKTRQKACSKTIPLDSNLKYYLSELRKEEYMSFGSDFSVSFIKGNKIHKVGISKFNEEEDFYLPLYNELYKFIKETADVPVENCHWKKLVKNVGAFTGNTDNPQGMSDIGFRCPEL